MLKSESESSWKSWSFDVFVDVLLVDGLLDDFPGAEGDVSDGVEIGGLWLEGSESGSGGLNLSQLPIIKINTLTSFYCSTTLTILPKDGMTLMLMLLKLPKYVPVLANGVLERHDWFVW